jgi:hypothetical protein
MFACLRQRHAARSPATRPHQALTGECSGHLWIRRPDGGLVQGARGQAIWADPGMLRVL